MLTHLGRELTHAVLRLVLGGSFADTHKHSRCVKCGDGVLRRWLLRLLLHSADYKEKYVYLSPLPMHHLDSCSGPCWQRSEAWGYTCAPGATSPKAKSLIWVKTLTSVGGRPFEIMRWMRQPVWRLHEGSSSTWA